VAWTIFPDCSVTVGGRWIAPKNRTSDGWFSRVEVRGHGEPTVSINNIHPFSQTIHLSKLQEWLQKDLGRGTAYAHGACMNRIEANAFATNWIRAWNKRDIDAVLEHYVEDAKFISPKAKTFVGNAVIEGKRALSDYWHLAAKKIEKIEFQLDHIVWDSDSNDLIIFYEANLNGVCSRACEAMKFDPSGRLISAEALYGALI
jgi:ketosteroid isomerase-like protein